MCTCFTCFLSVAVLVLIKLVVGAGSAAIGMLMFQVAMVPRSPTRQVDIRYVEGAIEDQLDHLSPAFRDLLLDCLSASRLVITVGVYLCES
jgi:apolipoprotein N-acyltransferase